VTELGIEPEWKEKEGQFYYEYEKEGIPYKLWAEEKKSLALKALSIGENKLAGTAAWMMGGDPDGTWTVIKNAVDGDVTALMDGEKVEGIVSEGDENDGTVGP
jgi:spore germination protein YaaH